MPGVLKQRQPRRRFLVTTLALLGASIAGLRLGRRETLDWEQWLDRFAGEVPDAAAFGRRYLEMRPAEASVDALAREVFGEMLLSSSADFGRSIGGHVRSRRELDFKRGRLVVLGGWFFTATEARLMALLFLRRR
jgi:hypothetical protein